MFSNPPAARPRAPCGRSITSCWPAGITRDKGALAQDDRLDALAMGVAYFAVSMATDVDKAVARNRDRVRDAALRRFMGHVLGRKPAVAVWASRPS